MTPPLPNRFPGDATPSKACSHSQLINAIIYAINSRRTT